jgi:carbonic anhydrase
MIGDAGKEPAADEVFPAHLTHGYARFLAGDFLRECKTFHDLAEQGQHPHSLVIGCCDSRVMPEEIFGAGPGEIFDVRNVANIVPPFTEVLSHHSVWAAVDYGVNVLRVQKIVVLGHARCGGVRAFVEAGAAAPGPGPHDALGHWIGLIRPAAQRAPAAPGEPAQAYAERLARESVRQSLENLRGHPKLAAMELAGALSLHGAYFDIADARLLALDERRGAFVPLGPATP